jgi:hypothetical protein
MLEIESVIYALGPMQTMNQVFELAGDLVKPKAAHDLMRLIAEGNGEEDQASDTQLRSLAVNSYLDLLEAPKLPSLLLQVSPAAMILYIRLFPAALLLGCISVCSRSTLPFRIVLNAFHWSSPPRTYSEGPLSGRDYRMKADVGRQLPCSCPS